MNTPDKLSSLMDEVTNQTEAVKKKLDELRQQGDQISIVNMFEMQMLMNKLSQLSEISTGVVSAGNAAISAMARNIKS